MNGRSFFDSNLLIYGYDDTSLDKQAKANSLIGEGLHSGRGVISAQVLSEFFVTVTQKINPPLSIKKAKEQIVLFTQLMEVCDIDSALVQQAIALKQRWKISYWDALILAAAERSQCSILYSEDLSHGQRYGSVKVQNPFLE